MSWLRSAWEWVFPPVLDPEATLTASGDHTQIADLDPAVAEAFGISLTTTRVTRVAAMCIPGVRRARSLIAPAIGGMPLVSVREDRGRLGRPEPLDPERVHIRRALLDQPEAAFSRETTITWTVDDLMFYGRSWWRVTARDVDGFPVSVERVDYHRVSLPEPVIGPTGAPIPQSGRVSIDGAEVDDEDLIRIDAPDEGVLTTSSDAFRAALDLLATTRALSQPTAPVVALRDLRTDADDPLTSDEVTELLNAWLTARRLHGAAYIPPNLALEVPQWDPQRLALNEAREQMALDMARAFNLPATWVGAPEGGSLTYGTLRERRAELADITLAPYMASIAGRLSADDITPRGQVVEFDASRFLTGTRRDAIEDAAAAVAAGLVTKTEARNRYLGMSGPAPDEEEPADE